MGSNEDRNPTFLSLVTYTPAGQGVHSVALVWEKVPGRHWISWEEFVEGQAYPAGQSTQAEEPATE